MGKVVGRVDVRGQFRELRLLGQPAREDKKKLITPSSVNLLPEGNIT